jgi:hypothetical protein
LSFEIGGNTPNASQVRKKMFVGWPPWPDSSAFGMNSTDRRPDLRLAALRQADRLGVTAALEVEHAAVRPAVLVVADQLPRRISRERRLAGAGQAEEQRHVAVGSNIGRAVHREHVLSRQQEVHDAEGALLDLAGVVRPGDHHGLRAEVDDDRHLGAGAVLLRVEFETRRGVEGPVRLEGRVLLRRRSQEQAAREQGVPRLLGDGADLDAEPRVRADGSVLHELLATREVRLRLLEDRPRHVGGDGVVGPAPGHLALGERIFDDEAVLRRASGTPAGEAVERAGVGELSLSALEGEFDPLGGGAIRDPLPGRRGHVRASARNHK